jgi:CDP-glucose 4,6-dehydratase
MSFWSDKRILVTGATGLVGSWLTRALVERGGYVVALIRDWDPQSELIRSGTIQRASVVGGSLEDYATLERAINEHEVDTVFHLGAQTIVGTALRNPLATFEANVRGTYHLLEACRLHSALVARVIVASSDKAYGAAETLPYNEAMPLHGRHPYDVSKSCADLIALAYGHTYGLPIAVARCGNIYGGGDLNWSRIVPGTIRSLLNGQRPILRSDGTYTRDYVYVQDVVEAYLLLAQRVGDAGVRGEAFNFSPERPVSVLEIAERLQSLMGRPDLAPVILNQARAEIRDQFLDSSKARTLLDWRPQFSLDRGLGETIEWYKAFLGVTR